MQSATLRVDDDDWSVQRLGDERCVPPYITQTPCPTNGRVLLRLDTDQFSSGQHSVEAVLTDVAGNRSTVGPFAVSVRTPTAAPGIAAPPNPGPAARGVRVLGGRRNLRVSYSKPPLIHGTLKTPEGAPSVAARVAVSGTNGAVTDARGPLPRALPRGPSRTVTFAHGDSVQTVKLIVASPIRLKVSPSKTATGGRSCSAGACPGPGRHGRG